jgi:hypothetical protein
MIGRGTSFADVVDETFIINRKRTYALTLGAAESEATTKLIPSVLSFMPNL